MQRLIRIVLMLLSLTIVGTLWFRVVEDWPLIDALYMTVITLTTVGFREMGNPTTASKFFIIIFLVVGIGIFMYGAVELGEMVVRAELRQWWRKKNMTNELKSLKDHFIVCGFGRMGRMVCRHLARHGVPFVAIDRHVEHLEECEELGWPWIEGDATEDRTLEEAGVERARGLAAVLSSDADNLYVVMSAKLLSKRLRIIARAYEERGAEKLHRAGADQVVSLYASGASKMAQLLTNPNMGDFFEIVAEGGMRLDLAEIQVEANAEFCGKTLAETTFREQGIIIVGVRQSSGKLLMPPASNTRIEAGDDLFAMGDSAAIQRLVGESGAGDS